MPELQNLINVYFTELTHLHFNVLENLYNCCIRVIPLCINHVEYIENAIFDTLEILVQYQHTAEKEINNE